MPTSDSPAGSDLGGGRNADLRDAIPTLQTCFTASRDESHVARPAA